MTKNSEEILGWQMRMPAGQLQTLWSAERREGYLLVPKTETPLSVDKGVWPLSNHPAIASHIFDDFITGLNEAPNGLGVFQLKQGAIQQGFLTSDDYQIVGIGMRPDIAKRFRESNFIVEPTTRKIPQQLECLLGFDVCDKGLLSGLMNCGLEAVDQRKLRNTFAASLNAYGLFDQVEMAAAFANEINGLVPEHAPFVPASLFTLGKLS